MKKMIYESELKIMKILWNEGDTSAKNLAKKLNQSTDWSTTTTYTIIKKCIEKGLIERRGDKFTCHALITKEEAQKKEAKILADKMFNGSSDLLIASLLGGNNMSDLQIKALRNMIQQFTTK